MNYLMSQKFIQVMSILLVFVASTASEAAKFEDFTFYNEVGYGAGMGSVTSGSVSSDFYTGTLDYKLGIREKYLYLTAVARASYGIPQSDGGDASLGYRYGFGLGVEWDIPLRIYVGVLVGSGGDYYTDSSSSYNGGSIMEFGYFLSEDSMISLSIESEDLGSTVSNSVTTLMWTLPMDLNYPKGSWRKKLGTEPSAGTSTLPMAPLEQDNIDSEPEPELVDAGAAVMTEEGDAMGAENSDQAIDEEAVEEFDDFDALEDDFEE